MRLISIIALVVSLVSLGGTAYVSVGVGQVVPTEEKPQPKTILDGTPESAVRGYYSIRWATSGAEPAWLAAHAFIAKRSHTRGWWHPIRTW